MGNLLCCLRRPRETHDGNYVPVVPKSEYMPTPIKGITPIESPIVTKRNYISFRHLNVEPKEADVFADSKQIPVIPNQILGAYPSREHYLDVQFRLLREDFLRPLREAVANVKLGDGTHGKTIVMHGIKITREKYDAVRNKRTVGNIESSYFEVTGKMILLVPIKKNNLKLGDESDNFKTGSLLLLSRDNFRSMKFAEVNWARSDETETQNNGEKFLPVHVEFTNDGRRWTNIESNLFSMIESPAFYATYKFTLEYFQKVQLNKFPMAKYIVDTVLVPSAPRYLRRSSQTINFSVIMKNSQICMKARPLELNNWPHANLVNLDDSQYEALQKSLTQELTIIQGPPGTGKTHTCIQIVKMFLTNEWLLQGTPIMIVSFTNHSLDEVLERILEFVTDVLCSGDEAKAQKIILRLGGMSESKKIKPLTLKYKKNIVSNLQNSIDEIETQLEIFNGLKLGNRFLDEGILNFSKLPQFFLQQLVLDEIGRTMVDNKMDQETCQWFGIQPSSFTGFKKAEELFFIRSNNLERLLRQQFPQIFNTNINIENSEQLYVLRWRSYFSLVDQLITIVNGMPQTLIRLKQQLESEKYVKTRSDFLKSAKVVGMTTTGAVKNKEMVLNAFKSKIMIVEEAAHILEAHVVSSLTEHCEQMIMIGDHKQLRPLPADTDLGENYQLNVSLMERLVSNGIAQRKKNWVQLKHQHRMRPEIARMICPVIYEELLNHPIVYEHPSVIGCEKNIFFVTHQNHDQMEEGSCSYYNKHEANFVVDTLTYFINYKKCYNPSDITVIVAYLAQKNVIDKMIPYKSRLKEVRVSTIDGYQGEENNIILLSLVRSNGGKNVGFLATDNRVCVALSRARHGLFMIGNMDCLAASSLTWYKIHDILKEMKSIGDRFPFKTQYNQRKAKQPVKMMNCETPDNPDTWRGQSNSRRRRRSKRERPVSQVNSQPKYAPLNKVVSLPYVLPKYSPFPVSEVTGIHKFMCGHDHKVPSNKISTFKCIVNVMKHLPCGHNQKAHCHQSPDAIKCNACAKYRKRAQN